MFNNPLDYSQYSTLNLVEILKKAVVKLGYPADKMNVDDKSTISISFQDTPNIMLTALDNRLYIWSILDDINESSLYNKSHQILTTLIEPVIGIESNKLGIGKGDNGFELTGIINIEYILDQEEGLANIIEQFHRNLKKMY